MEKKEKFLKKFEFIRSFRLRIFLIIIAVGFFAGITMRYGVLRNYEEREISARTAEITNQMKILANHLITYNYLQDTSSGVINAELEQLSNLYDGRVLIINSNFKAH